jgi:hypothetical protein
MKKNVTKMYFKMKIIVSILIYIVAGYALANSFKTYYRILGTEYLGALFLLIIVAFILLYHLSILIHEIGHALTLNILRFKVKIFKVGPIKYINNADKGKIVFNKNGLFLGGGYVIPEINESIYDEITLNKFGKEYIYFIYSGIIITIAVIIISCIFIIFNKVVFLSLLLLIINWQIKF